MDSVSTTVSGFLTMVIKPAIFEAKLKAEKEIEINKVRFKQLLCKIGKNNVVETNKGIAILDIAKYTLDYLTPQNEFKGLYFMDQRLQFGKTISKLESVLNEKVVQI